MKRLLSLLMALSVGAMGLWIMPVSAEPDYTDSDYWEGKCTPTYKPEDKEACEAYRQYVAAQRDDLQKRLDEVESQRAAVKADLETYAAQISGYQAQIDELQVEIDTKQGEINAKQVEIDNKQGEIDAKQVEIDNKQIEIDAKQVEIDNKQKEIDDTQAEVDAIKDKIKTRMSNAQSSMRFNKYLDILMGAGSFEDLLRIITGINSIAKYDKQTMDGLVELIEKMNRQKEELLAVKEEMEAVKAEMEVVKAEMEAVKAEMEVIQAQLLEQKNVLITRQNDITVVQAQIQLVQDAAVEKEAEYRAQSAQIAANISSITATMAALAAAGELKDIPAAAPSTWTFPVPGARRSAGTWAYASGYEHLGYDFAAPAGTTIYAIGSGVVLSSANGCATYGGLGNMCGYQFGGAYCGGNQVHYLIVVNGSLYGVAAYHMMLGSPIASGTIISGGTPIGQVGSSGNSSGPHCHIEIIYLGDGSKFENYARTWNGDLAFGAGWQGNNRKCDAGYGAPCRIRPETIFGY